jgi:hypothetical protein
MNHPRLFEPCEPRRRDDGGGRLTILFFPSSLVFFVPAFFEEDCSGTLQHFALRDTPYEQAKQNRADDPCDGESSMGIPGKEKGLRGKCARCGIWILF